MVHASLFSGIGGFEIAAAYMGWENAFHCEINEWCGKILKYYFPNSEHYEDITKTDFSKWRGKIDVLTGGFPCQPFSLAGQRKGANDERYLWPEMLRAIREVRPAFVIGENVAGIASMVQPGCEFTVESQTSLFEATDKETLLEQEYVIETVCSDLEREGYSVQPILIPACSIGAPHRRDRVWFIAHRNSFRRKQGRSVCGRKTNNKKNRKRVQFEVGRFGKKWFTANSDGERCDDGGNNREERCICNNQKRNSEKSQSEWAKRKFRACKVCADASNTTSEGFQRTMCENPKLFTEPFRNFPTQSPVCCGNDGFSDRLDGITFSKWRKESVKAYGNAIVPQVAYEIFKAIEKITNL